VGGIDGSGVIVLRAGGRAEPVVDLVDAPVTGLHRPAPM
jgi:hypothetical protein